MADEAKKKPAKEKKVETQKKPETEKAEGEEKGTCFIIMPITTPGDYVERLGDPEHFVHVLKLLFLPAIEAAGFRAIPPNATGAQNIQAEIIKNLETADLVLCDMSSLNANVFFELGVRTALNKPVCLVTDDVTAERLPFDTSTINRHTYSAGLESWLLEDQKSDLEDHIKAAGATSSEGNTLWRYFSMTMRGEPGQGAAGTEDRLEFLTEQVRALRAEVAAGAGWTTKSRSAETAAMRGATGAEQDMMSPLAAIKSAVNGLRIGLPGLECHWVEGPHDGYWVVLGDVSESTTRRLLDILQAVYGSEVRAAIARSFDPPQTRVQLFFD